VGHDDSDAIGVITGLTGEFFDAVSFGPGERPHYEAIRRLFVPSGILIKGVAAGVEITSIDDFIRPRQKSFEDGVLTEFRETEVSATTAVFGHAAHRESVYEKTGLSSGLAIAAQGIIFTQFVWSESNWLISSMAWDDERSGLSLADRIAG
jgi:hypothetical protein